MHQIRRSKGNKALRPLAKDVECLVPFVLRSARRGRATRTVWLSMDLYELLQENLVEQPVDPAIGSWRSGPRKSVYLSWDIRQNTVAARSVVETIADMVSMAAAKRN